MAMTYDAFLDQMKKDLNQALGKETIDTYNTGESRSCVFPGDL